MTIVNKFCCYENIRSGGIIIAWLELAFSLLGIILGGAKFSFNQYDAGLIYLYCLVVLSFMVSPMLIAGTINVITSFKYQINQWCYMYINLQEDYLLVIPFLFVESMNIPFFSYYLYEAILMHDHETITWRNNIIILSANIILGVKIYFFICILSLYKVYKMESNNRMDI